MSERIKSNQISRLSREEKEMLTQQVATLSTQVEKAVNSVFKYRAALWAARAICTYRDSAQYELSFLGEKKSLSLKVSPL